MEASAVEFIELTPAKFFPTSWLSLFEMMDY